MRLMNGRIFIFVFLVLVIECVLWYSILELIPYDFLLFEFFLLLAVLYHLSNSVGLRNSDSHAVWPEISLYKLDNNSKQTDLFISVEI